MSRVSCSSTTGAVTRTFPNSASGVRGPEVLKVPSLTELCSLQYRWRRTSRRRPFTVKALPALRPYSLLLRIRAPVCYWWWDSPFWKYCTSKQQLQCCSCGGNHTANYRGYVKWMEAKAALANKGSGAPSRPAASEMIGAVRGTEEPGT